MGSESHWRTASPMFRRVTAIETLLYFVLTRTGRRFRGFTSPILTGENVRLDQSCQITKMSTKADAARVASRAEAS